MIIHKIFNTRAKQYLTYSCFSVAQSCLTLCKLMDSKHQVSLSFIISHCLLKLMSIESVMPYSHLILCRPLLLLPLMPPTFRVYSNESTLHIRWPKYWTFSFSISLSNEHPGLIFYTMLQTSIHSSSGTLSDLIP